MSILRLLKQKGRHIYSIEPEAPLSQCMNLLNRKRIGALLVLDKTGRLQGIVSERDILRTACKLAGKMCAVKVKTIMTPGEKLVTATSDQSFPRLMELMTTHRVRHVPIMDGDKVLGVVSIGDVVKWLLEEAMEENKAMKDYISGHYA